ncbi:hypothetical protein [Virgisporangium aurantiacum]|uniref:Uncharacterized protein n=1 Tax=Virgisporangium aurantiacum TaxID=175570 RepID=A0A8J4DZR0_9ACTN|nr:hypothetical protein [Virgisporangium aurantiacum]GIJ55843.1 hypothetical protein Vau01_033590 [Virgisporangium aurantiacum]
MMRRLIWLLPLALLVVALFTVEEKQGKVAGCHPPPNEGKLLDRYEDDRAIQVRPAGARGRDPIRTEACVELNREDTSAASVLRRWFGKRPYSEAELRGLYDGHGWEPVPVAYPTGDKLVHLWYCRVIETVVSYLSVLQLYNTGDDTPYEVNVSITAWAGERSCPPPART